MAKKYRLKPYFILLTIYVFWAICGYGSIANYLAAAFCLLLLIHDIYKKHTLIFSLNNEMDKAVLLFIAFFTYYLTTSIVNTTDVVYWAGNVIVYVFVSFYPIFIYRNLVKKNSSQHTRYVLIAVLIAWVPLVLYSIIYFLLHPGVARDAIVYQSKFDNLFIGGGYPLAYGSAVICVYLYGQLRHKNIEGKYAFWTWCLVLISFVHVLLTNSTLTTIWMIIGFILTFLLDKPNTTRNHYRRNIYISLSVFLLISLFIIFRENIGSTLMMVGDYSSESLYSRRVYELGTVIKGDVLTRHTMDRLSKPIMSFGVFKESPILGIGYKSGYNFKLMETLGLGNHSEVIDSLAKYGMLGFPLFIGVFVCIVREIQKNDYPNESNCWLITLGGMMIFNPFVSMQSLMALFLIIPTISQVIKMSKIVQN